MNNAVGLFGLSLAVAGQALAVDVVNLRPQVPVKSGELAQMSAQFSDSGGNASLQFQAVDEQGRPVGQVNRNNATGDLVWSLDTAGVPSGSLPLRLLARKGDDLTLNMPFALQIEAISDLERWRTQHFGALAGTAIAADDADPDGDGLTNLEEYALGLDPNVADNPASLQVRLPDAIVGGAYDEAFPLPVEALAGAKRFSGKLPAGLKLDARNGRISGTPTLASRDQAEGDTLNLVLQTAKWKRSVQVKLRIKPLPAGLAGVFNGPIARGGALGGRLGGRLDLTIQATGAYSGKLVAGTETFPVKGALSVGSAEASSGSGSFEIKPKGGEPLRVAFTVTDAGDALPETATLTGGLQDGEAEFSAWRNPWLAPEADNGFAGYHTFGLELSAGSEDPAAPRGWGFGSVTVARNGKTTVSGQLADGERFATTGLLGPKGEVLVFQSLYKTALKGSVVGSLELASGDSAFANEAALSWLRPADPAPKARVYREGFGPLTLTAFGGRYTAPAKDAIVMGLAATTGDPAYNAAVRFDALVGAETVPVSADVFVNLKAGSAAVVSGANPKRLTLVVKPATGAFSGRYTTSDSAVEGGPVTARTVTYQGLIVNDGGEWRGVGYFLRAGLPDAAQGTTASTSPIASGAVQLQAASNR